MALFMMTFRYPRFAVATLTASALFPAMAGADAIIDGYGELIPTLERLAPSAT